MAQKINRQAANHNDNNLDRIGEIQCAVVAAFVDESQYRTLKGISLNFDTQSQQSRVVAGSQLHQKPTIKERLNAYNQAQTDNLHLDLLNLGFRFTKVSGAVNGDKASYFIVYNDNLANEQWQKHIEQVAKKYNHPAFIYHKARIDL